MLPTAHLGLNSEHRAELDRLSRGWFFRPTMNYGDYRGYTFVLAGFIGMGAAILYPDEYSGPELWSGISFCLLLGLLVLAITARSRRSRFRQQVSAMRQLSGRTILPVT